MRTLAVWTNKGGVGKTSAAVNLAYVAATRGNRTLLWDLDAQGAASFFLRIKPHVKGGGKRVVRKSAELRELVRATDYENLDLLPADFSYRHLDLMLDALKKPSKRLATKLAGLADEYDWVLLDCPPSVSLISEGIVRAADAILVPVIPTALSLRTLEQVRSFAAEVCGSRVPVLPFLSMVDRRKRMHREAADSLAGGSEGFLQSFIPVASMVEQMGSYRTPVGAHAPSSPAAQAFATLFAELEARLA